MRSLSNIIKAAQLRVLVPNEDDVVVYSADNGTSASKKMSLNGTILEASNLIEQAHHEAEKILHNAREEAASILAQVNEESETIRLQSKEQGWDEGYSEGAKVAKEEVADTAASLLRILQETIENASTVRTKAISQLEQDFLKLSLLVAEKIMRKQIKEDPLWVQPLIAEALERLGSAENVIVKLNPEDYAALQNAQEKLNIKATIAWDMDDSLTPGSCIIDTEYGAIDASFERRLGRIARHLQEVIYSDE